METPMPPADRAPASGDPARYPWPDELRAIYVAAKAHAGQTDKAGEPYILHVLRVVGGVPSGDARVVAALHDVVEDGGVTLDELALTFRRDVVDAVDALTRRAGESYDEYVRRVAENELATTVKLADIRDHLHPNRVDGIPASLANRYRKARMVLTNV